MKKLFIAFVCALVAATSFAQNLPSGIRDEIVEISENEDQYTVFGYKDQDGTFGYYLSLGHVYPILEILSEDSSASISNIEETCLYMGATKEDIIPFLDSLLEMIDQEPGATAKFPCRKSNRVGMLTESGTATAMVVKRFLQTKRLSFIFTSGSHTVEADLTKSTIKSLRTSFSLFGKK